MPARGLGQARWTGRWARSGYRVRLPYAAGVGFMSRIARKIAQVQNDLGSANQVVGEEIQTHFVGHAPTKVKVRGVDTNEVIDAALARGMELNVRPTQLEPGYDAPRTEMPLNPANLRRVVDTALRINHQSMLMPNQELAQDTDVDLFDLPTLTSGWHPTLRGLDTRLTPGDRAPGAVEPCVDRQLSRPAIATASAGLAGPVRPPLTRAIRHDGRGGTTLLR